MTAPVAVGFIGLGDQGAPIAQAIAEGGWALHAWARRPASFAALDGVAHARCGSIRELAERCDLVCLCVRDDADVEGILGASGLLLHLPAGAVVANLGTGAPEAAAAFARLAARAGVGYVDAPVSGGRPRAERRLLTTIVGGADGAVARCRPVFESFSARVVHVGGVGDAQLVKLLNNVVFAANLQHAEAAVLVADSLGFALGDLVELLRASSGASYALDALADELTPDAAPHVQGLLEKDLAHLASAARQRGAALSSLEAAAADGVRQLLAVSELLQARRLAPTRAEAPT